MNINLVKNSAAIYQTADAKEKKAMAKEENASATRSKVDTLEISSEAKKLSAIQIKIEQGFYNRPEIIEKVAKNMLQDM